MVRIACLVAVFIFAMTLAAPQASAGSGPGQGFGYYFQWFRDADGDGIPNGLDDDWIRPGDGTGHQLKHGNTGGDATALNTDGNVLRKQYRFRYDPAGDGERLQIHKRLRDGNDN